MGSAISNNNFFVECERCGQGFDNDKKCDSHLARVCDLEACDHKILQSPAALKVHQATMHGVPAKEYLCSADDCDYKRFSSSNVYSHERRVHNFNRFS